jgi:hypothetical protein
MTDQCQTTSPCYAINAVFCGVFFSLIWVGAAVRISVHIFCSYASFATSAINHPSSQRLTLSFHFPIIENARSWILISCCWPPWCSTPRSKLHEQFRQNECSEGREKALNNFFYFLLLRYTVFKVYFRCFPVLIMDTRKYVFTSCINEVVLQAL